MTHFGWLQLTMSFARAHEEVEEPGCALNREPGPSLTASWALSPSGAEVAVQGDTTAASVVIEARAWFGGLEIAWTTSPYVVEPETCATLPFEVPAEAFLHPLATEYVTDVLVRVVPVDAEGRPMQETALPPIYAVWSSGALQPPVVWDAAMLSANAPLGVLDPDGKRTPSGDLAQYVVRIQPPIGQELNLPRTLTTDERKTTSTVPVDDNSDEEVE